MEYFFFNTGDPIGLQSVALFHAEQTVSCRQCLQVCQSARVSSTGLGIGTLPGAAQGGRRRSCRLRHNRYLPPLSVHCVPSFQINAFMIVLMWHIFWISFTRMTLGRLHVTDYSNVCVSGLWDPYTLSWLDWVINLLGIPKSMLPEIRDSTGDFGVIHLSIFGAEIPINCVVSQ